MSFHLRDLISTGLDFTTVKGFELVTAALVGTAASKLDKLDILEIKYVVCKVQAF